jgi:hypothetical protein
MLSTFDHEKVENRQSRPPPSSVHGDTGDEIPPLTVTVDAQD